MRPPETDTSDENCLKKLVKSHQVNLFLAGFLSFETTVGVQQPRDETVEAGRYQLSTSIQQPFPLFPTGDFHWRRPPRRRRRQRCRRRHHSSQRLQIAKTRQKISSLDVISRVFPSKFQQIYIYFRFRRVSFILKICQTVADLSMVCQFHEFF